MRIQMVTEDIANGAKMTPKGGVCRQCREQRAGGSGGIEPGDVVIKFDGKGNTGKNTKTCRASSVARPWTRTLKW